jgi:O-antigen/teichoic acid export membrane protein
MELQNNKSVGSPVFKSTIWGIISKFSVAGIRFITIPLLIGFYGKADYGLIALAFSLNAYMRLMDLGLNTGAIRFFSIWISKNETQRLEKAAQSSMVFYGVIGLINTAIFVFFAFNTSYLADLNPDQTYVFKWMLLTLAVSSTFNWMSNVVSQLLTSFDELPWINKIILGGGLLELGATLITISLKLSMEWYFFLYTLSILVQIPLNLIRLKKHFKYLSKVLLPKWNSNEFKEIMSYSITIFAMGMFQFSANSLRPILLSKFASGGVSVVTDFRILDTISAFVIALGAVFTQALLPTISKLYAQQETEKIHSFIYNITKYVSIFICFIIFGIVANSGRILMVYVGTGFEYLYVWLAMAVISLLGLHSSPVASLVLSMGKTKPLAIMSALSCIISLLVTGFLAPKYNVGAAVIGYTVYQFLQVCFYYFYYNKKVLNLNNKIIFFNSFVPALCVGIFSAVSTWGIMKNLMIENRVMNLLIGGGIFSMLFAGLTFSFVIKRSERALIKSFLKK